MLLTADHNRVRGLFARFTEASESDDQATMTALVAEITKELVVHTTIEEEIFYPAVRDAGDDLSPKIAEALEEHHVAKTLLAEIEAVDPSDEAWTAKVQVLIESVEHHAGEEEEEMFPEVRKALPADALVEIGTRLDARKGELGAPTLADREDLTMEQLRALAKEQEIPGRSSMDREELAATVAP
jgi:hemerythrin superfamily protein